MLAQGVNIEDIKQQYRDQMMYQMVIQRDVSRSVFLTDEEIEAYYEEHKEELSQSESVRLREILISTALRTEEQAADRTREVLVRIRKGDDFGDLAREYSDAPTAQEGGELGTFDPTTLSQQVQDLVVKLLVGGVADPQLTPEGYMIIQLADRTEGGVPPLEKARNAVSNELYMDRVQPAFRKFLDRMRKENYVFVKVGYTDSGAIPVEPKPVLRGRRRREARSTN
jgi:parvulin-like peptidyl-prolyl isomerase